MYCEVCREEQSRYKCPVCLIPYCSVTCCKIHKETPCSASPKTEDKDTKSKLDTYQYPTEDTVPIEQLKLLDKSESIKNCLNNPHLRQLLNNLDLCDNPAEMMAECMQEPIFTEFVDECLNVIAPQEKSK